VRQEQVRRHPAPRQEPDAALDETASAPAPAVADGADRVLQEINELLVGC
jgi:hypothetical protein